MKQSGGIEMILSSQIIPLVLTIPIVADFLILPILIYFILTVSYYLLQLYEKKYKIYRKKLIFDIIIAKSDISKYTFFIFSNSDICESKD